MIRAADLRARGERLDRLKYLHRLERNARFFPASQLAVSYYEEARLCWYMGTFIATIIMTQLAFEELLRSHFRRFKGAEGKVDTRTKINQASFGDLVNAAETQGWISTKHASQLNRLRKELRNPYVHTKDLGTKTN